MKKTKPIFGWALLSAFVAITAFFLSANPDGTAGAKSRENARPDIIVIDELAASGRLEFPGVTFKHDLHSEALAGQGKDCAACHQEKTGPAAGWNYKFGHAQADGYDAVKELYHTGCISCHGEETSAGRPAGPLAAECRSCHNSAAAPQGRLAMSMDKYLHARHIETENIASVSADDANCGACHHIFDPQNADTRRSWKKQEEDSCRACHLAVESVNPEDDGRTIPALENASHDACVSCHFAESKRSGADKSGPYNCAGCHSQAARDDLLKKRPVEVKRLDRGQPDSVMILPVSARIKAGDIKGNMSPAPFDHKTHESALDNCRVCHHEGRIAACGSCHSLEGDAKGNFVNLAEAMHKTDSDRSCAGCHSVYAKEASCAGCHASMPEPRGRQSCAACHITPVGASAAQATDGSLLSLDKETLDRAAAAAIYARNAAKTVLNIEDVPEKVSIGVIADEYQAVDLPHRKIVKSLADGLFENKLAQSFHTDVATMCQGCHHNSPVSLTPPKCASCHASASSPGPDGRPQLKVAYHNQCMGCHSVMKIEKPINTDCAGCHTPAEKPQR